MSMLSAQCDELRAMAESVGLAMPQAATLMMEAADTIWELRNKCSNLVDERERLFRANVEKNCDLMRLMDENAKLISVLHEVEAEAVDAYLGLQHDCELLSGELEDRFRKHWHEQVQNAKLRKLVDGWEFCSNTRRPSFDECVGCPLFVQTPHSYRCARNECMRELGVDE